MCTYNICLFKKEFFTISFFLINSLPLSFIQSNEHVEMKVVLGGTHY